VSKSGFYKWRASISEEKKMAAVRLENAIQKIHSASRATYGRRRVYNTAVKQGLKCGKNKISKLMKKLKLRGVGKPRFKVTTNSSNTKFFAPNLIVQDFRVCKPDVLWTSDITFIPTRQGWLYLSIVLDAFSRNVAGWAMGEKIDAQLVVDSITMAAAVRKPEKGVIFHSDRGSQYGSNKVRKRLKELGMHQSMSSTGNCYDNSITETFFATLKKELIHRCNFLTRKEAKTAIFEYIEVFYNRIRSHSALGYLSPLEYERKSLL
jgi:transposase InsO family protein